MRGMVSTPKVPKQYSKSIIVLLHRIICTCIKLTLFSCILTSQIFTVLSEKLPHNRFPFLLHRKLLQWASLHVSSKIIFPVKMSHTLMHWSSLALTKILPSGWQDTQRTVPLFSYNNLIEAAVSILQNLKVLSQEPEIK